MLYHVLFDTVMHPITLQDTECQTVSIN